MLAVLVDVALVVDVEELVLVEVVAVVVAVASAFAGAIARRGSNNETSSANTVSEPTRRLARVLVVSNGPNHLEIHEGEEMGQKIPFSARFSSARAGDSKNLREK